MAGKAKKMQRMKARLAGEVDTSLEVPFELFCDCGERISGVRRPSSIQKQCDQCGDTFFILPINVYPATRTVASEVIGGTFADRLKVVVTELLPTRKKSSTGKESAAKETVADSSVEGTTVPNTKSAEPAAAKTRRRLTLPRIDVKQLIRQTFTPFRLVMLGMIAIVGLTGYWLIQQRAQEAAQQVWLQSSDEVDRLLKAGQIVELEALLKDTVDAGRTLGKNDREWRRTISLYQQAIAINNLAAIDLLTAFHGAYQDRVLDETGLQDVVDASRSGTFIFDTWLSEDYQTNGSFRIEMPAAAGKHVVSTTVALPQFEQFLKEFPDCRILFAAKLGSIEAPGDNSESEWKIQLSASSLVLLTDPFLADNIGLSTDFDDELATIIRRQDEFVKSSKTWEFRAEDVVEQTPGNDRAEESEL